MAGTLRRKGATREHGAGKQSCRQRQNLTVRLRHWTFLTIVAARACPGPHSCLGGLLSGFVLYHGRMSIAVIASTW